MKKTLIILRHAKAASGADDKARPLNERGFHEAEAMGEYLRERNIHPEKIFCSTSMRTRQTLEYLNFPSPPVGELDAHSRQEGEGCSINKKTLSLALPHKGGGNNVEYTDALYVASLNELLHFLAALPDTLNSVMLIGHNPGLHELCIKLAKNGDEKLRDGMAMKFPPCALATITLESWDGQGGTLTLFKVPDSL